MRVHCLPERFSIWPGVAVAAALFALFSTVAQAEPFELQGQVVRVADGDTLTVLLDNRRQQRVRLSSIDAPELSKDARRPGQPYAQASRRYLSELVAGKQVRLACRERDRHGRAICDVLLEGGETANQKMVQAGLAMANREKQERFLYDARIDGLEQQAKEARLGIWSEGKAVPPWEWRYHCWQRGKC
ncbi:MAG TPA: thermonuclease family protein [Alcaligenes sp.]|nr:thermonuclease family protein [Alcaligenes sp.]HRL26897.1 thermonuclease family protein [Alcaligenes sp.]